MAGSTTPAIRRHLPPDPGCPPPTNHIPLRASGENRASGEFGENRADPPQLPRYVEYANGESSSGT